MEKKFIEKDGQGYYVVAIYSPVMWAGALYWECLAWCNIPPTQIWTLKTLPAYRDIPFRPGSNGRAHTFPLTDQEVLDWIAENAIPDVPRHDRVNGMLPEDYYSFG